MLAVAFGFAVAGLGVVPGDNDFLKPSLSNSLCLNFRIAQKWLPNLDSVFVPNRQNLIKRD